MVIGTLVGLTSGFFAGWPARVLFRLTEWFLVIPFLPLAIVLATRAGPLAAQHRHRHRRDVAGRARRC